MGPTPPPCLGPSIGTEIILRSRLKDEFSLIHVDTSDERGVSNIGKFDIANVLLGLRHWFDFLLKLSRDPDLVYVPISQGMAGFLRDSFFLLLTRALRIPAVVHLRGSAFKAFYSGSDCLMRILIEKCLERVRFAVVLGERARNAFDGILPEARIRVVANGMDGDGYLSIPRDEVLPKEKGLKVLFLSNLFRSKGVREVLLSVPAVLRSHSETAFIFAGSWGSKEEKEDIESLVEEHNLGRVVRFVGPVDSEEKLELLKEADIFVFPPVQPEGQPWVILEAMAAGLPIVTTDQGCISEMVLDGENGFIVPPGEPQAIAQRLLVLLKNPELRRSMGKAGRRRLLSKYTEEKYIDGLRRVFLEALNGN